LTEDDLLASDALFSELSYSILFILADKKILTKLIYCNG